MNASFPIILIGMHRSGTSLLAEVLQDAGIWMGADHSKRHTESRFFMKANRLVYARAHAAWDNPLPMNYLLAEEQVAAGMVDRLRTLLGSPRIATYLGFSRYWQIRSLANLDLSWGWKDPLNTFVLPFWLRIFPQARVLNIYRNGVDVASSLQAREKERAQHLENRLFSCRCLDLDRAFQLWEEYVEKSFEVTAGLPEGQVYHLCYETFLQEPQAEFEKLAQFLEIDYERIDLAALTGQVKGSRAYAFQGNPALLDFYRHVSGRSQMQQLGYGNLIPSGR